MGKTKQRRNTKHYRETGRRTKKSTLRQKAMNWSLLTVALGLILVISNILINYYARNLQLFFGAKNYAVEGETEPIYFAGEYESGEELLNAQEELCKRIEENGIVLLRNENEALPLRSEASISVWNGDTKLKSALEEEGFSVKTFSKKVSSGYENYADAAIVVIQRQTDGESDFSYDTETGTSELQLTQQERDLLAEVCGVFDCVVVLLQTDNPIETGFLEEYQISACLWIGNYESGGKINGSATGALGCAQAAAEVISGTVNPSGRLTDTYVYDQFSAPTVANAGDCEIVNSGEENGDKYLIYAEGIYVGYRYYETRYEDVVTGAEEQTAYDYQNVVMYPFGYGLSYTDFAWNNMNVRIKNNVYTVSVDVTNTGAVSGRDVVQIYLHKPYTDYDRENSIEKASVELVGFAKTQVLEPGETQTVSIEVSGEVLKSYDAAENQSYLLEAGVYYLTAGADAHTAVNNILLYDGLAVSSGFAGEGDRDLVFTFAVEETDTEVYAKSVSTKKTISNTFSEMDIRSVDTDFAYLSRSDWSGTWPTCYKDGEWKVHSKFLEQIQVSSSDTENASAPVYNSPHGDENLTLAQLRTVESGDYRWENLLDQLSWKETYELVSKGGGLTNEILSVGAPNAKESGSTYGIEGGFTYPSATVLAATWDRDLLEELGSLIGEDALKRETTIWFAPSLGIHRTAFGGRNAWSFSEDPMLSGLMGAALYSGAEEMGVIAVAGDFALETQVTNREGVLIYTNEQTMRELYLKSFEICVRDEAVSAVQVGMNRAGARWCGGHSGLISEVLREEWGFDGIVVTGELDRDDTYCDILEGLEAGTDLWLNTSDSMFRLTGGQLTYGVRARFRSAAGRILVAVSRSNAMNGIGEDSTIVYRRATWRRVIDIFNAIIAAAILIGLWTSFRGWSAVFMRNRKIALERRHRREVRKREQRKKNDYWDIE